MGLKLPSWFAARGAGIFTGWHPTAPMCVASRRRSKSRDAPSWSPDGKWIAVAGSEGKANPLFKVPVDGGPPVRLVDGVSSVISNPVWSPDGRFILYSEGQGSSTVRLRGITPDRQSFALPEIRVPYAVNPYRFLPDGKSLVVMQGVLWRQNFRLVDLATGGRRQLTDLRPEFLMKSFDVSPDGKQILFDRYRRELRHRPDRSAAALRGRMTSIP